MIGRTLSHFRIVEKLGQGGMGVVYKAFDEKLRRTVALKTLPPELVDQARRRRFQQEAQAASALNHAGIITVYEIGFDDGIDFIVMEYVEGQSLRDLIGRNGLPFRKALKYCIQISEALSQAHRHGIIHCDLKPQNIMITRDDNAKVLDFGLSKLIEVVPSDENYNVSEDTTLTQQTHPGILLGTPHYMSPEQAEGKAVDARADIFSFGSVVYEMLAGRHPFSGTSVNAVLSSILRDTPEPLPVLRSDLPQEMILIISKALEKDLTYRYQHMDDLRADLKRLERDLPELEKKKEQRPRRFSIAWFLSVLLAAISFSIGLRYWQTHTKTELPPKLELISIFPGSHQFPCFSPDGSLVAFVNDSGGNDQVWIKNLVQGNPIQITFGDNQARHPKWSPSNDQILFDRGSFLDLRAAESIWSIPPLGGTSRKLMDGRNPTFSWDGKRFVYERGEEIWIANSDGSDQHRLEGLPNVPILLADRYPEFSPDASQIVYFQSQDGPTGDLWLVSASGGNPRRLTFDDCVAEFPAWTPDGKHIIYVSSRSGTANLWKVPVSGGQPEPVTLGPGEHTSPEISRDGKRIIFSSVRNTDRVQLFNVTTQQSQQLLETSLQVVAPIFSPKGNQIAFFGGPRGGRQGQIFVIDSNGSNLSQVTYDRNLSNTFPFWSPDGKFLYAYSVNTSKHFLRKIPLGGGQASEVLLNWKWETQWGSRLDPTGQLLVYSKREGAKVVATPIRDLSTGKEKTLHLPLDGPSWSKDGNWIAGERNNEVFVCPVDGSSCKKLTDGINAQFSPDGTQVFFQRQGNLSDGVELWSIAADGSDEKKLTDLRPMPPIEYFYDVSPKHEIVWVQYKAGSHELWLLQLQDSSRIE